MVRGSKSRLLFRDEADRQAFVERLTTVSAEADLRIARRVGVGVAIEEVLARSRRRAAAHARAVETFLAVRAFGLPEVALTWASGKTEGTPRTY